MQSENLPGFPPAGWEPQMQRLNGPALSDDYIRQVGVGIAKACVGLSPSQKIYQDALYPWDLEADRAELAAGQHKCALTALMILRAMGFELPSDGLPYASRFRAMQLPQGRRPPADAMTQLRQLPGYVPGKMGPVGSAVIIGRPSEPSSTHVAWVVGHALPSTVLTVDGGMLSVAEKSRRLENWGGMCLVDKEMGIRPIIGHVDPARMRQLVRRDYCLPVR